MTVVLRSPPQLPSSPSTPLSCSSNDGSQTILTTASAVRDVDGEEERKRESRGRGEEEEEEGEKEREVEQLSVLAFLLTVFRKVGCRTEGEEEAGRMEIGWPTNVRHVAHVTFDRFHGFLGLPVEFEPEVPRRAPSASAKVFGVSTESMQCSYDCRGNSIPTILLLMQRSLYEQGGLLAEGIFRINAENSQEEYVRDQLNSGIVPNGIDVHCLAGLIKAWFRELPTGVLDSLSPDQVMQCQSEEDCARLARNLPPTEGALLNWAVNLMADVVQEENQNKMNARNVAMVFAPNMTQMADPLTALMYAVQVMNFLKMLILKTLKEREDSVLDGSQIPLPDPNDENDHHCTEIPLQAQCEDKFEQVFISENPEENSTPEDSAECSQSACKNVASHEHEAEASSKEPETSVELPTKEHPCSRRTRTGQPSISNQKKAPRKYKKHSMVRSSAAAEKSRGASIVSRINSKSERVEAWR
ncbi:hypothetical protein AXF42_Ash005722 [Apostasia shenzhenica]|uniref:Rho GTPase-activating protein 1 n=1 Tax=Apostasia shenzhenica TaxID=1088818 RepID=A0A2I0BC64_9ASPA|nr:hypothetical protein AXF42_Ash005722 [Apostasia shenzhenica]